MGQVLLYTNFENTPSYWSPTLTSKAIAKKEGTYTF